VNNKNISVGTSGIEEIQLTHQRQGHFLNQRQAFSPDDQYLVFDNRNEDSKIGENGSIQLVDVQSQEIQTIYRLDHQTSYGPGTGAASFHPKKNEVVFIHGLMNASPDQPYGLTERFAMQVNIEANTATPLEARNVREPYTKGALRGGSHAYSYSADGRFVSFTYNDAVLAKESRTNPQVHDLRTVGAFFTDHQVLIDGQKNEENFDGNAFAVLLARVTHSPQPGSDEINKAYEEGWVGNAGYTKRDGQQQRSALAFLGDVISSSGVKTTEVFVVDLPENGSALMEQVDAGSNTALPSVPAGVEQRRLTFAGRNNFHGVQGPRQWLRSSPDGAFIYFYSQDEKGVIQICAVSPNGGNINWVTKNDFSADTSFSLSPDGKYLAYGAGEAIYLTRISDGTTLQVLPAPTGLAKGLTNINWSNAGYTLAYNRKVDHGDQAFYQVFKLDLSTLINTIL